MKKKLLFIMPSLCSGGAEKSLVTLLSLLDGNSYDIDLLLFRREGLFLPNLPEYVCVFDAGEKYALFDGSSSASIKHSLKHLDVRTAAARVAYARALESGDRTKIWNNLKIVLPRLKKHYDAAIGYLEGNAVYYCVDCVDADIKIGYVHNDYSKLGMSADFDRGFFKKLDYLVSVSPECSRVLSEAFPEMKDRIRTVENITSPAMLRRLADAGVPEYENLNCVKLLTVGRLNEQKGYRLALDAAERLAADGVDFKWFSIGRGDLLEQLESTVKEKGLEDRFIFLGERANPYPYAAGCDIYVQTSLFEGKSIAIDEAKCFAKPIVATKFSTVFDQLADGETALLAEMSGEDIAEKIEQLIADKALRDKLTASLISQNCGNEYELEKFCEMID